MSPFTVNNLINLNILRFAHTHTERCHVWTVNVYMEAITLTRLRRVWRYQRDNQNPYMEEEQIRQLQKEKVQWDKQRSTKHTDKTKDRVTRTPLTIGGERGCSGRVNSVCSTSDACRVNLLSNSVISHEWVHDHLYTALCYSWHQNMIYCDYKCLECRL